MDEIDAIGGRRFSEGTSADREIQRTLMELLNQLDGFDQLGKVCSFNLFNKLLLRNGLLLMSNLREYAHLVVYLSLYIFCRVFCKKCGIFLYIEFY